MLVPGAEIVRFKRMRLVETWKARARQLGTEIHALSLACRDPRVPWYAKGLAALVVGYALSPIDLIPDFIPVLGYLDDLVLVPLGILLVRRMIPAPVLADCRVRADAQMRARGSTHWAAAAIVVTVWVLMALLGIWLLTRHNLRAAAITPVVSATSSSRVGSASRSHSVCQSVSCHSVSCSQVQYGTR